MPSVTVAKIKKARPKTEKLGHVAHMVPLGYYLSQSICCQILILRNSGHGHSPTWSPTVWLPFAGRSILHASVSPLYSWTALLMQVSQYELSLWTSARHSTWWIITFSWKNCSRSRLPNYYVYDLNHFYIKGASVFVCQVSHVHNGLSWMEACRIGITPCPWSYFIYYTHRRFESVMHHT